MTFKELNLSAPLLRAVQEAGYETPSPIQAAAIPPVLSGRDLMGCAQTGTGKTAAFALPMLDRLTANAPRRKGAIRALILTPTRELALQIGESFDAYGKYLKLRSTVIFGGVGQAPQVEALKKGVDILIACPGRLNDLIGQGFIDLSNLEIFVLDEADRMLDMGFVHDVKKVIAKLPGERQNLMFSATMPAEIEQLAAGILRKPAVVKVDPVSSTVDRIQQSLYHVEKGNKKFLLPWLIKNLQPPVVNALVFSRTKHGADKIAKDLTKQGIPAAAIHGHIAGALVNGGMDDGIMVVQISFQHIGTVQSHADFFHMHAHPAFAFMQNGTFHISNILLYLFAAASGCYTLHACGPTLTKKSRPKAARKPRWGFQCFTNRKLLSGLFGGLLGGILDHSSLGFNSTSLVDGLCIGQNVTGLLLNFADGLHGGVLHAQHGSSGLGVDLLGVFAGQQLETGRTEQRAGGEQCDLLDIHSNFPTFSISCQRPCTAGPVR